MVPLDRKSNHRHSIESVIHDVQFSRSNHSTYKKVLTDMYNSSDTEVFITTFLNCLKICLLHEEKSPNVELTLDFAAEFAVSFSLNMEEDDICPLLEGVFQFIFDSHDCQIPIVRLRICQLMNRLLDNMGANATVAEETYDKIATSMLVRLKDSMSSIRTQAVYALNRLQTPSDPDCDIIRAFKFHMMHDPCHEVRRAIIQKIAVTKASLAAVITRLYDVKDIVRKDAYNYVNRLNVRQFTIRQRQTIIENGLTDRSDLVQDYVIGTLVLNWLKNSNFNFYDFLECIHVEKIPENGIKLLKAFFEKQDDVVLESKIKEMWIINREISYDKLNIITVVFWRALAEYLKPSENSEQFDSIFDQVLPDLTPFCNYIRGYFFPVVSDNQEITTTEGEMSMNAFEGGSGSKSQDLTSQDSSSQATREESSPNRGKRKESLKKGKKSGPEEAVLIHLLEMCKVYDYSDEMGRKALQKLCAEFLESPSIKEKSTVATLAKLLDDVMPNNDAKLNLMAEIITELREPLQDDNSELGEDLLLLETEEKKTELQSKIKELEVEMEIAEELNDIERIEEIKSLKANLSQELKILNKATPLELGRNVNNDPAILKKCLTIVIEIMRRGKVTKMNSTLYSLVQNFITPTLKLRIEGDQSTTIKNLALEALSIFCTLDSELAKESFVMYCMNIANELLSVTCLKSVFDLLYVYDLALFEIEDPDSVTFKDSFENDGEDKPNLIILLMSILTRDDLEMRKTAVIGLCKMLFVGKVKSPQLVSKLILLWYNPDLEGDPYVRQPLGTFFSMFATTSPHAPSLFQKAFIPTIRHLFYVDVTDSLAEVDVLSVASLMLEFTKPNFNEHMNKDISIHNQIAISICEEILTESYEIGNCVYFFKMLFLMEINCGIETDYNILSGLASRISKVIARDDRMLYRYATKFKILIEERHESNKTVSTVDNTLPAETTLGSRVISQNSQLLDSTRYGRDSAEEEEEDEELEEEEEEDLSQDLTAITKSVDDLVIPGTPETSDSESEDFKGFDLPVSKTLKVEEVEFKLPSIPPAKTPFKKPTSSKTPRKTAVTTPVKHEASDKTTPAKTTRSAKSPTKTPGKASASKSAKTPGRTPAKVSVKTPAKTRSSKTPSKRSSQSPPRSPPVTRSSPTKLRSAKKRKS